MSNLQQSEPRTSAVAGWHIPARFRPEVIAVAVVGQVGLVLLGNGRYILRLLTSGAK